MIIVRKINDWLGRARARATHKSRAATMNMGQLFIGFILIIVGLALQPTIQASVETALVNASAMVTAVLNLVPLVWVLVVVGVGVVMVYDQFRPLQ